MSSEPHRSVLLDTWTETSAHMFDSVVAANKAAFAAFGVDPTTDHPSVDHSSTDRTSIASSLETDSEASLDEGAGEEADHDGGGAIDRIEPAVDLPQWDVERTTDERADLSVGDRFEFTKTITEANIRQFAVASGDTNPLHLDDEFADQTRFQGRIAHGTLVGGLISAALARIPGLVVYLSQDLEFHNPVRVGDRLTAECEIVEDLGNDQYRLTTRVVDEDNVIIDGEAVILIDELPRE